MTDIRDVKRKVPMSEDMGARQDHLLGDDVSACEHACRSWSVNSRDSKPRILDLFCGAGGAAVGYARAGFEVVGVDHVAQPHYPFEFFQADAFDYIDRLTYRLHGGVVGFDAIHASPPCQAFTAYKRTGKVGEYPDLIARTRELLKAAGLPYVIENVVGAPLLEPTLICGSMFDPPMDIRRHRLFETNWPLESTVWPCRHKLQCPGRFKSSSTRKPNSRQTIEIGSWDEPLARQQEAMGIDWMTLEELSEAIPPAYTHFIGLQLRTHLAGGPWEPPEPDPRLVSGEHRRG